MTIQKDVVILLDALEEGFNRALPDPKTNARGPFQPVRGPVGDELVTYCNRFVSFVAEAFGYRKFEVMTANIMHEYMENPANGWIAVDGAVAQSHANEGCLVIASQKNLSGHGHLCVICPGKMQPSGSFGKGVPKCVNVGKDVFFGKKVSFAFRSEPKYFVLGEMV